MILNQTQQKSVIAQARREMQEYYDTVLLQAETPNLKRADLSHYCLFHAFFILKALRDHGVNGAQIQAGTAWWPIIKDEEDDGVSPNQYGYYFTWDRKAANDVMGGVPPEMHVWVAIIGRSSFNGLPSRPPELIDITAPFFKIRAISEGYKWCGEDPPDFLWVAGDKKGGKSIPLPKNVIYQADPQAIEIANAFLEHSFSGNGMLHVRYLRRPTETVNKGLDKNINNI